MKAKQPRAPEPDVTCLRCTRCGLVVSASTAQAAHAAMLEHQRYQTAVDHGRTQGNV